MCKRICGIVLILMAVLLSGCGSSKTPVDLDLSGLEETEVYTKTLRIAQDPEAYVGQTIRIKGIFSSIHSEAMNRYYYSCVAHDKDGCCTEGLEFILPEGEKYPEPGDKITVVGTYAIYEEDGGTYGQLEDAILE